MATITRTTTTVTKTITARPAYQWGPARGWLKTLGWISILLGIVGLIPYVTDIAHDYNVHFEAGQMLFHWVFGIACLVAAYAIRNNLWMGAACAAAGAILVVVGLLGFVSDGETGWHAGPADSVLHLLLGIVSLLVGIKTINRDRAANRGQTTVVRTA